jgi:hypothetical protein
MEKEIRLPARTLKYSLLTLTDLVNKYLVSLSDFGLFNNALSYLVYVGLNNVIITEISPLVIQLFG